jgi:transcriptional regulator of aromatic amino acid metabolism
LKVTDDFQQYRSTHPAAIKLSVSNALRGVVCALSEPTMLVDMKGMIFAANPAVTLILQAHNEYFLGKSLWSFVDLDKGKVEDALDRLAKGAPPVEISCAFQVDVSVPAAPVTLRLDLVRTGPEIGAPLVVVAQLSGRQE